LDIGGGPDSIGIYRSLFPLMRTVTVYDLPQGDAQYLDNVSDDSFDFVYSAHCLEHVVDPFVAINNWMRVLKPNGHLIITIPDEDMYEQKVWPSTLTPTTSILSVFSRKIVGHPFR
jgi:ubiquinone/menaquinone biosynthesis C-methylase UbiE